MAIDIANRALLGAEELTASTQPGPVTKTSRRVRNDEKWNSLKDEIHRIYMIDDFTLRNAKRVIEERHGFKAR
jgi:hypothetical protein